MASFARYSKVRFIRVVAIRPFCNAIIPYTGTPISQSQRQKATQPASPHFFNLSRKLPSPTLNSHRTPFYHGLYRSCRTRCPVSVNRRTELEQQDQLGHGSRRRAMARRQTRRPGPRGEANSELQQPRRYFKPTLRTSGIALFLSSTFSKNLLDDSDRIIRNCKFYKPQRCLSGTSPCSARGLLPNTLYVKSPQYYHAVRTMLLDTSELSDTVILRLMEHAPPTCESSSHLFCSLLTSSRCTVCTARRIGRGHTGGGNTRASSFSFCFLPHLPSAVRAFLFIATRIQPSHSLVNNEVEVFVYSRVFFMAFHCKVAIFSSQKFELPNFAARRLRGYQLDHRGDRLHTTSFFLAFKCFWYAKDLGIACFATFKALFVVLWSFLDHESIPHRPGRLGWFPR